MSSAKIAPIFAQAAAAGSKDPSVAVLAKENARLTKRVVELEKEVKDLKGQLSKKRKAVDGGDATSAGEGGPPASKKSKTPAQRKKLFEKWSKALTRLSAKSKVVNPYTDARYSVEVKETTPWSPAEFEALFGGHGRKIQPLPDNKPTSQTTILKFDDFAEVKALFGDDVEIKADGYTAGLWKSRSFQKSYKMSDGPSELKSLEVSYNKSKQTLSLKFNMVVSSDYW